MQKNTETKSSNRKGEAIMSQTEKSLKNIKSIIDSFYNCKYTISADKKPIDIKNHDYDLRVIMGMISNHVYEGLGLDIPDRMKNKTMIKNGYRYTQALVLGEDFLKATANRYRFVSQRPSKGNSEKGTEAGVTGTFQIVEDNSEPVIDKVTGLEQDNNVLETFDATILGATYPLPYKKGDFVALENFEQSLSYYINFNFILRFRGIKLLKSANPQGQGSINNVTTGQTK